MTSGALLSSYLILSLIAFGLVDVGLWITGRQTMSQWIIKKAEQNVLFGYIALLFCLALVVGGIILIKHWELPCILFKALC
jgi:hypothetical protein